MGERCEACGRPFAHAQTRITDQELNVLSAWWTFRDTRAVAKFFGTSHQTVKNQLQNARNRNAVHSTSELAFLFMADLRSVADLAASHNKRQNAA